jgi:hypothetical protein
MAKIGLEGTTGVAGRVAGRVATEVFLPLRLPLAATTFT